MKAETYVITPLDKGYQVDMKDGKVSGHNTRKNAVQYCLNKIPREKQFMITVIEAQNV